MYKKGAFRAKKIKKLHNYLQDLGTQGAKYCINEAIHPITWIKPRYAIFKYSDGRPVLNYQC